MLSRAILATILFTFSVAQAAAPGSLAPPTDEQVAALIAKVKAVPPPTDVRNAAARAAAMKATADAVHEGLKEVSISEASLAQIEQLNASGVFGNNAEVSRLLEPRLTELAKEPGVAGARAAELRIMFFTPYVPPAPNATAAEKSKVLTDWYEGMRPVLSAALTHPGAVESVKAGNGVAVFARVGGTPTATIKADRLIEAVEPLLLPEMSLEAASALGNIVMKAVDPELGLDKARRDRLLSRIAAAADGPLARPVEPGKERLVQAVRDTSMRAKSAYLRGELIGGPAPALPFSWCSDPSLKELADTKGSVVVLDFWATLYDPCITAFPRLREFTARYREAGSLVRVIAVTSLQGRHIKRSLDSAVKPQRIDCNGQPDKEYGLMAEFMADMGMTWTVAFTPDGCFNPNFGVMGIPHFAVIDAAGKVRYNEIRPGTPAEFKVLADQVDELLKEAGLKVPDTPAPAPAPPAPATPVAPAPPAPPAK